jgi:formylglycine-generating enzyme required for sulfatase activity
LIYKIRDSRRERSLTEDDFPITIGSTETSDIPVAGLAVNAEAAVVTLENAHPLIKPGGGDVSVQYNGRKLEKAVRLNDGDVVTIGLSEVVFSIEEKICIFYVSQSETVIQAVPLHAAPASETPVEIEPISFRSSHSLRRFTPSVFFKWIAGFLFGVVLIVLGGSTWFVFTARQVVITIEPVPEDITFSGSIVTPRLGNYYLMRPGEYTLEASRECFFPLHQAFQVSNEKQQNLHLEMQKLPGQLMIGAHQSGTAENTITGAQVFVDGTGVGSTPIKNLEVKPGLRRFTIRSLDYQDVETDFEVKGCGESQEVNMAMLPGWSDVTISSVPQGAEVQIDGTSVGNTPVQIQHAAGTYVLEISADGYKTWKHHLIIKANEPQEIKDVRLDKADGKLAVYTEPAGANVIIDGTFAGYTPVLINLSPDSSHVIQISKAGYEKATRTVKVPSAASRKLNVSLSPREGIVHLLVEPADTEILVNGKSQGSAPKRLNMIAVEHTLEFKKKGYRSYTTRITPRPGFPQHIKVVLKKEPLPGERTPPEITTKSGYRLTLRPFYMGLKEVTNREFREFAARHNSGTFKSRNLNGGEQPVVRITWEEAALFCNWLSAQEKLPAAYIKKGQKLVAVDPLNSGYRLPTEAEWEYAARFSGKETPLKYPWGQKFPPGKVSGNYADQSAKGLLPTVIEGYNDGYATTSPTATFKSSAPGLYDMGGNVAEWSHDYYSIYSYDPEKTYVDPVGPKDGKHHVIRGSSWKHGSISTLRLAYRGYSDDRREDVGFRVCRYIK